MNAEHRVELVLTKTTSTSTKSEANIEQRHAERDRCRVRVARSCKWKDEFWFRCNDGTTSSVRHNACRTPYVIFDTIIVCYANANWTAIPAKPYQTGSVTFNSILFFSIFSFDLFVPHQLSYVWLMLCTNTHTHRRDPAYILYSFFRQGSIDA